MIATYAQSSSTPIPMPLYFPGVVTKLKAHFYFLDEQGLLHHAALWSGWCRSGKRIAELPKAEAEQLVLDNQATFCPHCNEEL